MIQRTGQKIFLHIFGVILAFLIISQPVQGAGIVDSGCLSFSTVIVPMSWNNDFETSFQLEPELQKVVDVGLCKKLEKMNQTVEVIKIGLLPIAMAGLYPGVREALARSAIEVGALLGASPVLASVTVLTATGIGVAYIVLKITMSECRAMNVDVLKQEILEDLYLKHGIMPSKKHIPIRINDGRI